MTQPIHADSSSDTAPLPNSDAVSGKSGDVVSASAAVQTLPLTPILIWVATGAAAVALVVSFWLWQRLDLARQELAKRAGEVAEQVTAARVNAEQAQALSQTLQARLAVAEIKLSEVSLQRTQLEELMLSLSRSRDDTLVQDIESGLRLAVQQAEVTGSAQPLVSALVAADRRIAKAAQPRLNPVQRAVTRDIERIRGTSVTDVPALVQRLDELVRMADDLQLLNAPPRTRPASSAMTGRNPAVRGAVPQPAPDDVPHTVTQDGALGQGWAQVSAFWQGLWAQTVQSVTRSLSDLVRVGRIDRPEAVLLAPDQAFFLRENLKLKVLNARLGLLSRQVATARADLGAVRHMLATYFEPHDPATRQALQVLSEVLQASKTVDMPRPDETLAALAAAAGGR